MTRRSALLSMVAATAMLSGCPSNAPRNETRPAASSPTPAVTVQQPVKSEHDCVYGELAQHYVVETARLEGEPSAHLDWCFVSGYRGIGCQDNGVITNALGHSLSNRERAGCDAIMRRMEVRHAAEEARKKQLDKAYDKQHGLKPAH